MKNVSFILSIVSLIAAITFGTLFLTQNSKPSSADRGESTEITANAGDIVYVNLDQIIMGYDFASDLWMDSDGMVISEDFLWCYLPVKQMKAYINSMKAKDEDLY